VDAARQAFETSDAKGLARMSACIRATSSTQNCSGRYMAIRRRERADHRLFDDGPSLTDVQGLILEALAQAFPCKRQEPAQFTAKTSYESCSSKREPKYSFCALYISGFVAGTAGERTVAEAQPSMGCLAQGSSPRDAITAFVQTWHSLVVQQGKNFIPGFGSVETVRQGLPALEIARTSG
jgi:hypothetical protein